MASGARGGKIHALKRIDEEGGFVVIDCRDRGSHELSEIYQAFAMLCAQKRVHFVLLKTGHEDAEAHYSLRDVLATVAHVVRIPLRFRLALVAGSGAVERVYRAMRLELRALGCDARVFRAEGRADRWLRAAPMSRSTSP